MQGTSGRQADQPAVSGDDLQPTGIKDIFYRESDKAFIATLPLPASSNAGTFAVSSDCSTRSRQGLRVACLLQIH
jgi:hypothetical protein